MKKLLLAAVVLGGAAIFGACSSATQKADSEAASFKAQIENCTDPDSLNYYVDQAVAYAQKLADEGKVDEAAAFLKDISSTVQYKAPEAASYFEKAKAGIDAIVNNELDSVKAARDEAVDSAKAVADSLKNAAKEKAEEVKEAAKEAAKEKAAEAAEAAKAKANEAAAAAADKAKDAAKAVTGKLGN